MTEIAGVKAITAFLAGTLITLMAAPGSALAQNNQNNALDNPIVFAGSSNYPPFHWIDDNGEARGFLIDLQIAIATRGGIKAHHRLTTESAALSAVKSGDADAVALFASEAHRKHFDFTEPFYHVTHGIFSKTDGPNFDKLESLRGHTVAVVTDSYSAQKLTELAYDIRLLHAPTELACIRYVSEQTADACVDAVHSALRNAGNADLDVHQTSPPFWPRPYVFGVRKGEIALRDWLNQQLTAVIDNNTYHEIYNKWLPELEWRKPTLLDLLRKLSWLLLPTLLLILAAFLLFWPSRRKSWLESPSLMAELERRKSIHDQTHWAEHLDLKAGFINRNAFTKRLDRLLTSSRHFPPSVIAIRILNLEHLAATFGFSVTDEFEQVFAERLISLDFQLLSHFSWGAFLAIPKTPVPGDRIISLLSEPLELSTIELSPEIAAGVAPCDKAARKSVNGAELVRRASRTVLVAHEQRQASLEYSPELEPDSDVFLLLRDFHREGTKNMFLLYQPQLDLKSGVINAAEALVRWQHPKQGLISPARFIPLLEETGRITELTRWAIKEAAGVIERAHLNTAEGSISVNITPRDLIQPDILKLITVAAGSVPLNRLRLEITETGFIEDPTKVRNSLTELRNAGIYCAVDDFGTGYSSLSYLSDFPVYNVKLDYSFVSDMLSNKTHQAIVRSTIELAHELGMTVTAEGVEDERTIHALADLGCDVLQGFAISRPIPEEELLPLLGKPWKRTSG